MAKRSKKNSTFEVIILIIVIAFTIYNNLVGSSTANNNRPVEGNIEVEFLDVGQADSILIRTKDKNALIDAGNNEDGPLLVEYFKSLGINTFDYVIGTHAHEDHIGGMDDVIKSFDVKKFYMPNVATTTKTFTDILDALEEKGYKFSTPKIDSKFSMGDVEFEVIYVGEDEKDLNSTSIVLRMDHGANSFLFTGDSTTKVEKLILDKNIDVDVLKVAHHGSTYSNSLEYLKRVSPKYAVIQVGKNNTYFHPHEAILKRLNSINAQVYRTDEMGTIVMESDGNVLNIKTIKTQTNG